PDWQSSTPARSSADNLRAPRPPPRSPRTPRRVSCGRRSIAALGILAMVDDILSKSLIADPQDGKETNGPDQDGHEARGSTPDDPRPDSSPFVAHAAILPRKRKQREAEPARASCASNTAKIGAGGGGCWHLGWRNAAIGMSSRFDLRDF